MVRNKVKEFLESRGLTVYRFQKDTRIARRTAYDLTNKPDQLPAQPVLSDDSTHRHPSGYGVGFLRN